MKQDKPEFKSGRGYTRKDWQDAESPPATDAQLTQARPFTEAFPELADSIKRGRGRPPMDAPRQQISIRLDPDVIAKFKATGPGWQQRINATLKAAKV